MRIVESMFLILSLHGHFMVTLWSFHGHFMITSIRNRIASCDALQQKLNLAMTMTLSTITSLVTSVLLFRSTHGHHKHRREPRKLLFRLPIYLISINFRPSRSLQCSCVMVHSCCQAEKSIRRLSHCDHGETSQSTRWLSHLNEARKKKTHQPPAHIESHHSQSRMGIKLRQYPGFAHGEIPRDWPCCFM